MKTTEQLRNEILSLTKEYYFSKFADKQFIPGKSKVHYAGRFFDEKEMLNLMESSLDFWLTAGRFCEEFEYRFAEYFGVNNAITVNSGSSANLVAISTLTSEKLGERRLKEGDEVITLAAGFPTTVAPIIQNKLIPVYIDVELGTYNVNCNELENAISSKTKAIFIAHTLGNPFNLKAVMDIAKQYNLWVVEDNCDALGSEYDGKLTGTYGHIACCSFYPAHHITMGEGGCVVTNDDLLGRIARSFRDWGRDCYCNGGENNTCGTRFTQQFGNLPVGYDHKYVYSHVGYNLKITDMQAAVGLAQLDKLSLFIEKRRRNYEILKKGLSAFQDKIILPEPTPLSNPSWFAFLITVKENAGFTRNDLVKFLESNNIETRNLFSGNMTKQPAFMNAPGRIASDLRNTDFIMNNTFFIGLYPGLNDEHLNYVLEKFKEFFSK